MTTTNTSQEATATAPTQDLQDVQTDNGANGEDLAKGVLAEARYSAFKLMTDSRAEAETILEDARAEAANIVKEAEMKAESIVDAARLQASDMRTEPASEPSSPDLSNKTDAQKDEISERVSSLRSLADELEQRFTTLTHPEEAAPAPEAEAARPPTDVPEVVEPAAAVVTADEPADEPAKPEIDYSPAVAAEKVEPTTERANGQERGSFYSRRSAKLPRIGDAGGKSALDMMRSIRDNLEDTAS